MRNAWGPRLRQTAPRAQAPSCSVPCRAQRTLVPRGQPIGTGLLESG
jgi:hypothetical protein